MKKMDALDKKIKESLNENARLSFRKIAEMTGKSTDTIINRYNKMEKSGYIKGSTITLDRFKLGFEGTAVYQIISGSRKNITNEDIIDEILKLPNVLLVGKTIGVHDILVLAAVKGLIHFEELFIKIIMLPGVMDVDSCYWTGSKDVCPQYFSL